MSLLIGFLLLVSADTVYTQITKTDWAGLLMHVHMYTHVQTHMHITIIIKEKEVNDLRGGTWEGYVRGAERKKGKG